MYTSQLQPQKYIVIISVVITRNFWIIIRIYTEKFVTHEVSENRILR